MSSGLMDTEAGGEGQQYGGKLFTENPDNTGSKKSGGQLGQVETTTNPSETPEGKVAAAERAEKTTENIRYGQTITETGGMSGMTEGMEGRTEKEGFGSKVGDRVEGGEGDEVAGGRRAQGYGGDGDMDREVGA
ncbi:hypothetical protein LTR78_010529 [Recurvomyces mirabilis]|uniref:Uncharacterized protein n=1 Tax=Recurvomyces mirabilis TaxID=574656 RepID=A0AAE0WF15_9PEZI|nr:hypothetical protein LTR78_010529 [Recurvomyces mirabilis]KAK5149603.1 hypothetical protein LTS14_010805 [Recurvomyces mirabilis]